MSLSTFAFIFIAIVWGSNFIYMKMAAEIISPIQVVYARLVLGFIPILGYTILKRSIKLEHFKYTHHFIIMSTLAASLYYYGFVVGSNLLPSGIAGALSGSIPIFSFLLATFFLKDEEINIFKIIGILLGFIGVLIIANPFATNFNDNTLKGTLFLLMGSLSLGSSFIYAKKFIAPLKIPSSALVTYQLGFASLIMTPFTSFEGFEKLSSHPHALIGLIFGLGILGTALAYIAYYYIIDKMGAIKASSVSYLPPVVALFIGSVIVNEPISLIDYFGTSLILIGVILLKK